MMLAKLQGGKRVDGDFCHIKAGRLNRKKQNANTKRGQGRILGFSSEHLDFVSSEPDFPGFFKLFQEPGNDLAGAVQIAGNLCVR